MRSFITFLAILGLSSAFTTPSPSISRTAITTTTTRTTSLNENKGGLFGPIQNFFEELDAFVDDATSRRLGAGSAFYGKRKSNFYGDEDTGKKQDRSTPDPTEDYQGPSNSGYFQWARDENGQMRPITRLKGKNIERNPSFWDRTYAEDEKN
mmetsp:Transcript_20345/g.29420  ORF Transcript_20345/g.29420 Transcript_20345/m.29420 type:complete len:152 (+) Transcript_20345:140-595(+)|eukprot:CAMPEP_0202475672 /NCGR_PEP_ID=MMETSP1360-20130828/93027_1 /ASSEMBLY_ACC=CAM_ASM_000848 /TAXON_ID=515479 /ORGANISM="Licmophora paradoxa, Strain CCMP2313" /LENGTH=151 /DNA_ID=CAMNT_0049102851 /DNA_START=95 /DNA_END=550 /DNA_ORIENTATION=-